MASLPSSGSPCFRSPSALRTSSKPACCAGPRTALTAFCSPARAWPAADIDVATGPLRMLPFGAALLSCVATSGWPDSASWFVPPFRGPLMRCAASCGSVTTLSAGGEGEGEGRRWKGECLRQHRREPAESSNSGRHSDDVGIVRDQRLRRQPVSGAEQLTTMWQELAAVRLGRLGCFVYADAGLAGCSRSSDDQFCNACMYCQVNTQVSKGTATCKSQTD